MEDGANSTLSIAKVGKRDSGNYTCFIQMNDGPNEFYTITVHILHGKFFFLLELNVVTYEKDGFYINLQNYRKYRFVTSRNFPVQVIKVQSFLNCILPTVIFRVFIIHETESFLQIFGFRR